MGWREDFKDHLLDKFKEISGIGSVLDEYTMEPPSLPALILSLGAEDYEHQVGVELITLPFEIMGKVKVVNDIEQEKQELADDVIEKIDTILPATYCIFLEGTDFHPKVEGGGDVFIISGYLLIEKDFSSM